MGYLSGAEGDSKIEGWLFVKDIAAEKLDGKTVTTGVDRSVG